MISRIKLLTPLVSNQIAAGEVVERPASVIKELLENSLDANAKHIQVDVEKGGMRRLRVSDDGCGIHKDDLALALSRHATSKIESLGDLQHIASLGFRGEALASMSAVSRMTLLSCAEGERAAWKIQTVGDDGFGEPVPCAHPVGTTIDVEDLFFNTPVRRQFLRSEKTELTHVEEIFKRLALSRFDVGFTFRHNQRELYHLLASDDHHPPSHRIAAICGNVFLQQSLQIESHATGLTLEGWLGLPDCARSQNDLQYFYINGRVVRDRLINHAINQAYQDLLHPGRHPCYVLFLTIDPETVDVNVHPTKQEVRFRESRLIHDFIFRHLQDALVAGKPIINNAAPSVNYPAHSARRPPFQSHHTHHSVHGVREKMQAYRVLHQASSEPFLPETKEAVVAASTVKESCEAIETITSPLPPPYGKILGCLHQSHILIEHSDGLMIANIAHARRRIMYGQLLAAEKNNDFQSHPLLIPFIIPLSTEHLSCTPQLESLFKELLLWGIVIGMAGPDTAVVRGLPGFLQQVSVEPLLIDIIACWLKTPRITVETLGALSIRHFNIVPKPLNFSEMKQLLDELFLMEEKQSLHAAPKAITLIAVNQLEG